MTTDEVNGERAGISKRALARGLGLSPAMVLKLEKRGMPMRSIDAARQWRRVNLHPGRTKREPAAVQPKPSAAALRDLAALVPVAEAALRAGRFELIADALREAMRAVPEAHRATVPLLPAVWRELVRPAIELFEANAADPASASAEPAMSDEDAEAMGRFWYGIAAGEAVPVP